jgi:hypothetical protein
MKKLITALLFFSLYISAHSEWIRPVADKYADCFVQPPDFPNVLMMGKQGVSYSTDNGLSWIHSSSGMPLYPDNIVNRMFCSQFQIYAGLNSGIYNSNNIPGFWSNISSSIPANTDVKAITSIQPFLFLATTRGIFKKNLNGGDWFYSGLIDTLCVEIMAKDGILYTGSQFASVNVSLDTGRTWIKRSSGIAAGDNWVFTLTYNSNYIFAGTSSERVYRSSNNGLNWENVSTGLPQNAFDAVYSLKALTNNVLIAGTGTGIFASTNNGNNWFTFSQGLAPGSEMRSDGLIKFGDYLFAGFNTGIYRRPLGELVGVANNSMLSNNFKLGQNYPNPFNPTTQINYELQRPSNVSLKVYDIKGNEIAELVNEKKNAGSYSVRFDGSAYNLSSGIYFYKLSSNGFEDTKRMVLVK